MTDTLPKDNAPRPRYPLYGCLRLILWVAVLAVYFAQLEIQIEGPRGWAGGLPTWRIENHWMLDLFMGGRILTGYHFWAFSFMVLVFHLHFFLRGGFSWRLELRTVGCIMSFWIIEDFTWFVCNPAYGWGKFTAEHVPWHKVWLLGLPVDYYFFLGLGLVLIATSFRGDGRDAPQAPPPAPSGNGEPPTV